MVVLIFYKQVTPTELRLFKSRRDDLFVENYHNQKNEPHRGDLFENTDIINRIIRT